MVCVFQLRAQRRHRNAWPRFAQVRGRRIESLFEPRRGQRSGVTVLEHSVGRKMHVQGAVRPERGCASQKLDGLIFAAVLELRKVSETGLVRKRDAERVERSVIIACGPDIKTAGSHRELSALPVCKLMGEGKAQHCRSIERAADIAVQTKRVRRKE